MTIDYGNIYCKGKNVNLNATQSYYEGGGRTLGDLLDLVYPVGSIYINVENINPEDVFGGTWEQIKDRFLIGANNDLEDYKAGAMGGSTTKTLTVDNLPPHTHESASITGWFEMRKSTGDANEISKVDGTVFKSASTSNSSTTITNSSTTYNRQRINFSATHEHSSVGKGKAVDIMPPYLSVYIWKRIA